MDAIETHAMMIRHRAALNLLVTAPTVEDRLRLLDQVVCPGNDLLQASLSEARRLAVDRPASVLVRDVPTPDREVRDGNGARPATRPLPRLDRERAAAPTGVRWAKR